MKTIIPILLIVLLGGCAATQVGRASCTSQLDLAWKELDIAKSEGFSGTVSYSKAVGLLTAAKFQQTIERYDSCADKVRRARAYIQASKKGQ